MLYSVWKPELGLYEYYQDGKHVLDEQPTPKIRNKTKLGVTLSDASWKLPSGAKNVGSGTNAKGIIVHPSSLGDWDLAGPSLIYIAGLAIGAWFLYREYKGK